MADSGWSNVAGAATQALGQYAVNVAANKRQFKYQKEAMALQQDYNKELWDYQNAYNSPQQQMQRLEAAGLNPYLIYNGNANMSAGPIQPAEVPEQQAARAEVPNAVSNYLNARQMDAQYKATMQNIESAKIQAVLREVQTGLGNIKLMEESARSKNFPQLAEAELDMKRFVALRAGALYANEKSKGNLLDQMHDYRATFNPLTIEGKKLENAFATHRNRLAELGIYTTDHPAFRIIIQAAHRMGVDLGELLARPKESLKYLLDMVK